MGNRNLRITSSTDAGRVRQWLGAVQGGHGGGPRVRASRYETDYLAAVHRRGTQRAASLYQQVYQRNVAITTIPGALLRPLFGWKEVEMLSADDEERERPAADIYAGG